MSARKRKTGPDAVLAKWRREVAQARRDGRALADLIADLVEARPARPKVTREGNVYRLPSTGQCEG